jgi:hypothetical protein
MEHVYESEHWTVTDSPTPLAGARHHWVLTPRWPSNFGPTGLAWTAKHDFWDVLTWLRQRYQLTHFCLGARSWDGGAMELVVADGTPADPVRFDFGDPPEVGRG